MNKSYWTGSSDLVALKRAAVAVTNVVHKQTWMSLISPEMFVHLSPRDLHDPESDQLAADAVSHIQHRSHTDPKGFSTVTHPTHQYYQLFHVPGVKADGFQVCLTPSLFYQDCKQRSTLEHEAIKKKSQI